MLTLDDKIRKLAELINEYKTKSDVHINDNDDAITVRQKDMLFGKIMGLEMALNMFTEDHYQ